MTSAFDVCPRCARRSWLLGRLAPNLEIVRGERRVIREVLSLSDADLAHALAPNDARSLLREASDLRASSLLAAWAAASTGGICRHADDYPERLRQLPDAPAVLHMVGDRTRLPALLAGDARTAAIVGSRRASDAGIQIAVDLGRGLSAAGVTVVSGMALGIDAAAHRGALEARDRTVAVLACGPERAYPASKRGLHDALRERALVLSELPPGTRPYRWAFPARNRIIAALGDMTVIVEAAERSGSLITSEIALELGRDVGAVPGRPSSWSAAGANALLRDGARVVRGASDVIEDLIGLDVGGIARPHVVVAALPIPEGLGETLTGLLFGIDDGRDTVAALAGERPGDVGGLLGGLSELELLGHVRRVEGGRYVRARP